MSTHVPCREEGSEPLSRTIRYGLDKEDGANTLMAEENWSRITKMEDIVKHLNTIYRR
jgi:hypothetical protein